MIETETVLSPKNCLQIRNELCHQKELWKKRSDQFPFYTLGAASYLDARKEAQTYYLRSTLESPLLRQNFGDLYEKLQVVLNRYLGAPTTLDHEQAPPGFHLYFSHPVFETPIADVHFDRQHHWLSWEHPDEIEWSNPISFTLPLALPEHGGGIHLWELEYDAFVSLDLPEQKKAFTETAPTYHAYQLGQLAIHSGHRLHQIAPGLRLGPNDERITLQGHALQRRGTWQLYW